MTGRGVKQGLADEASAKGPPRSLSYSFLDDLLKLGLGAKVIFACRNIDEVTSHAVATEVNLLRPLVSEARVDSLSLISLWP
jgi:hypothetical protein